MCNSTVMVVLVDNRQETAVKVQDILTKYGCIIKMRLGLHEVDACNEQGLIFLQLKAPENKISEFQDELNALGRVKAKVVSLSLDN